MYLSAERCFKLDKIVKSFEVAFRCYIASQIIVEFSNEADFSNALSSIKNSNKNTSMLNSGLLTAKINKLSKESSSIYATLFSTYECQSTQDYDSVEVLTLGQLIDIIIIFFDPLFSNLNKRFETNSELMYLLQKYNSVRNDLSHPASSKIKNVDSNTVVLFVSKLMEEVDNEFFWYVTKPEIYKFIDEYKKDLSQAVFDVHNLNEISIDYKKLLCRNSEIEKLRDFIIGKDDFYRKSGSVVLYGYGGVGKTSVVTEFIYQLAKNKMDGKREKDIDFLLYFTSKEEKLDLVKSTGDLVINKQTRQIATYEDFINKLFEYLKIDSLEEYTRRFFKKGIIVIDNIETLKIEDKEKILNEFIKISPRNIQFIITSRNEERCEDSIYIEGFTQVEKGVTFINEYIIENDINIDLSSEEKVKLIEASKGNTLILILSLMRLNMNKIKIDSILDELFNISARNAETIANFMYKNTFDNVISGLEVSGYSPIEILRIISYYNEPIDLLTINLLCAEKNINKVEYVCKILSEKLILVKNEELYELNEFASKFVFIKYKLDKIHLDRLKIQINKRKEIIKSNLDKLSNLKKIHSYLEIIINDWKPRTYVDKLAVAEVFNLYSVTMDIIRTLKGNEQKNAISCLNKSFLDYELSSSHPYIRYQKARCFQKLLENDIEPEESRIVANDYFEQAILGIEYDYTFIQNTSSYAYILWLFGVFKYKHYKDYKSAICYYLDSKRNFEIVDDKSDAYLKVVANLCETSYILFESELDGEYKKIYDECILILNSVKQNHEPSMKFLKWHKRHRTSAKFGDVVIKKIQTN